MAANLEKVIEHAKGEMTKGKDAGQHEAALQQLGILNLKYFALDQKDSQGKTHTRAVLSFSEAQRGLPSWLAAPEPMGSLEYISPDANVVAGFVVKDPTALVDDLLGVVETVSPDLRKNLDKLQAERGLDIRKTLLRLSVVSSLLPSTDPFSRPRVKMVFEVNDPQHCTRRSHVSWRRSTGGGDV